MGDKEKAGILQRWIEKHQARVLAMLEAQLEEGESVEDWVRGQTAPWELLDWLPVLDLIHKAMRKHYVLALTNDRLLVVRTRGTSVKVKDVGSIPLASVASIEEQQWPFTAKLTVRLRDGSSTSYKEILRDAATSFVGTFEALTSQA